MGTILAVILIPLFAIGKLSTFYQQWEQTGLARFLILPAFLLFLTLAWLATQWLLTFIDRRKARKQGGS